MNSKPGRLEFISATLLPCIFLWSCLASAQTNPTKDEYRKIFTDAISHFLLSQKANNICLPPMFWGLPGVDAIEINQRLIDTAPTAPFGQASQLKALEEAELVMSVPTERMINNKMESFRTYKRTATGNRYFSENRFCYARAELNKLVKWKGPAVFGEYKIAWVYYTARVTNIADWVTKPAILAAFPMAKSTLQDDPDKVRQVLIDLSSEGWEANEWSRVFQ